MRPRNLTYHSSHLLRALQWLAVILVCKVTLAILLVYGDYFPPTFERGFLEGRRAYFFSGYHLAFYAHILSGPLALMLALLLIQSRLRQRWPQWHRWLGRAQVGLVLLLLTPSGLWMSAYAQTGVIAGLGFASLAMLTAICVLQGWRSARQHRFSAHQTWMWRTIILLNSALVLRVLGGLATIFQISGEWAYTAAAWASWLAPLASYSIIRRNRIQLSVFKSSPSR
ncbi:MAG: DUF2306 domain-containing protein [Pirellulaceae bacterium]